MNDEQLSKRLAYLLRHAPEKAGITLEPGGWAPLGPLLAHLRVSRERVEKVVAEGRKGRYALRGDRIRAHQGHSVAVELHLTLTRPPQTLYHGTHAGSLDAIRREGHRPMGRHHVHLSAETQTAQQVGARRGRAVVLTVAAGAMREAGHDFFRSDNGVWLTDAVPPEFITFP